MEYTIWSGKDDDIGTKKREREREREYPYFYRW